MFERMGGDLRTVEYLGLELVLGEKGIRRSDYGTENMLGWLNWVVLSQCEDTSPVTYANTLGLYYGTTALTTFRNLFDRLQYKLSLDKRRRCTQFVEASDSYLLTHVDELPTMIPEKKYELAPPSKLATMKVTLGPNKYWSPNPM